MNQYVAIIERWPEQDNVFWLKAEDQLEVDRKVDEHYASLGFVLDRKAGKVFSGERRASFEEYSFLNVRECARFVFKNAVMSRPKYNKKWDFVKVCNGYMVTCLNGNVSLQLKGNDEPLKIGRIDSAGNYIKGEFALLLVSRHKFTKLFQGWGVNAEVVKHLPEDAKIIYHTDEGILQTTRKALTAPGMRTFKQEGFDEQIIATDKFWEKIGVMA